MCLNKLLQVRIKCTAICQESAYSAKYLSLVAEHWHFLTLIILVVNLAQVKLDTNQLHVKFLDILTAIVCDINAYVRLRFITN